jgi:hypothetical protein
MLDRGGGLGACQASVSAGPGAVGDPGAADAAPAASAPCADAADAATRRAAGCKPAVNPADRALDSTHAPDDSSATKTSFGTSESAMFGKYAYRL